LVFKWNHVEALLCEIDVQASCLRIALDGLEVELPECFYRIICRVTDPDPEFLASDYIACTIQVPGPIDLNRKEQRKDGNEANDNHQHCGPLVQE
jgi:hypothetical protein